METIKCKMSDVVLCANAFNDLRSQKLSVKAALDARRIAKALIAETENFHEVRKSLIDKYAKKNEDGSKKLSSSKSEENSEKEESNFIELSDPDAFQKEFDELWNSDIDLGVRPMLISRLGNITFDGEQMDLLAFMIEDDTE